ncbi:MAG: trimethylamine methyltransferase family protein [Anaerolineales bacterium]
MTPGRKRGGRARRGTAPAAPSGISQPIVNSLAPLEILQPAQVEQLHAAALHILQNTGVVFRSPEALRLFRQAGARVHGERVYLEADLIEGCLQLAPAQYTLHARNPANTVTVGGQQSVVMPGGGPAFVLDLEGVRRPGTLADMKNLTRLSALSPEVHIVARKSVEAQDVPVALRHLECWRAALALADKPVQSGFGGRIRRRRFHRRRTRGALQRQRQQPAAF